jgi:hypothetical protein
MAGSPFHLEYQRAYKQGEILGPRLISTSPLVDGVAAHGLPAHPGSRLLVNPGEANDLVKEFADCGYPMVKAYSWLKPDAHRALGQACAQYGLRLVGHCPEALTFEQAIEAGQTCFEHLTNIGFGHMKPKFQDEISELHGNNNHLFRLANGPRLRLIARGLNYGAIRDLAQQMAELSIWNCPTIVVLQRMCLASNTIAADPDRRFVHPSVIDAWLATRESLAASLDWQDAIKASRERTAMNENILNILYEEHCPLLLGTDCSCPNVIEGFSIHHELNNFVASGISIYDTLRCATANAAEFLEEDDWGTIGVGKRAELLLLASNPLNDLRALSDIVEIYTNGLRLTRADIDDLLRDRISIVLAASEDARQAHSLGGKPSVSYPVASSLIRSRALGDA